MMNSNKASFVRYGEPDEIADDSFWSHIKQIYQWPSALRGWWIGQLSKLSLKNY